jgi:hypothetical protein
MGQASNKEEEPQFYYNKRSTSQTVGKYKIKENTSLRESALPTKPEINAAFEVILVCCFLLMNNRN